MIPLPAIIVSKEDKAGMNIASFLTEGNGFRETDKEFKGNKILSNKGFDLVFIDDYQLYADYLSELETDFLIFASKHKSESRKPTLTVHSLGNWGKADFGGKDKTLVQAVPRAAANYLRELQAQKEKLNLDYEVALECTHHGPYLEKPAVFIELGSSEEQWKDKKAAKAIAETILSQTLKPNSDTVAIGLGGGHYCPEFTKLVLRKPYCFSHICPLYALPCLDKPLLKQALEKGPEKVDEIVLDYKGLGRAPQKQKILELAEATSLPLKRVRKILKE